MTIRLQQKIAEQKVRDHGYEIVSKVDRGVTLIKGTNGNIDESTSWHLYADTLLADVEDRVGVSTGG